MNKGIKIFIIIAALILTGAALNAPLLKYYRAGMTAEKADIVYRIFGGLKGILADWAFMKGESYFHGGLPAASVVESGGECLKAEMAARGGAEPEEHHEHEHGHEHENKEAVKPDLYSRILGNLKVIQHVHLSGSLEKEVLPWFYLQVRFNPRDISGWVLGGYWLRRQSKYAESIRFLEEGEGKNPDSANIKTALGEAYFKARDYKKAIEYLEQATRLWKEGRAPNTVQDDYTRTDRMLSFTLLAECYKITGEKSRAGAVYSDLVKIEPLRARAP
jgi:tetratricopeptide (TPR) repeat protein